MAVQPARLTRHRSAAWASWHSLLCGEMQPAHMLEHSRASHHSSVCHMHAQRTRGRGACLQERLYEAGSQLHGLASFGSLGHMPARQQQISGTCHQGRQGCPAPACSHRVAEPCITKRLGDPLRGCLAWSWPHSTGIIGCSTALSGCHLYSAAACKLLSLPVSKVHSWRGQTLRLLRCSARCMSWHAKSMHLAARRPACLSNAALMWRRYSATREVLSRPVSKMSSWLGQAVCSCSCWPAASSSSGGRATVQTPSTRPTVGGVRNSPRL